MNTLDSCPPDTNTPSPQIPRTRSRSMSDTENQSAVQTEPEEDRQDDFVMINVRMQNGNVTKFRMRGGSPMLLLMEAFCVRHGLLRDQIRFLYDGMRVRDDETPDVLDMEDEDTVDAMLFQVGGGVITLHTLIHHDSVCGVLHASMCAHIQ